MNQNKNSWPGRGPTPKSSDAALLFHGSLRVLNMRHLFVNDMLEALLNLLQNIDTGSASMAEYWSIGCFT